MAWTGSIVLNNDSDTKGTGAPDHALEFLLNTIVDVRLSPPGNGETPALPQTTTLKFLSVVETSRIPCYIFIGAPWKVTTSDHATERWFEQIFAASANNGNNAWWESARPDSPLGVLVSVEQDAQLKDSVSRPRVSEILIYASRSVTGNGRLPTPPPSSPSPGDSSPIAATALSVHAIALSSDLLHAAEAAEPTLPLSPASAYEDAEAFLLPQSFRTEEFINEPPVRKRRSAADAFDEASERRKKARKRGGAGVIAAAAPKVESQLPSLKHRRSVSNTQSVPLQNRPLSRSPSVASSRPPTAVAQAAKKSSLSQVHSTAGANSTEAKNKDFISRIVMAGMRLYGLSQSKSRDKHRSADSSTVGSPAIDMSFEELEAGRKKDEEFKLMYHQVYKATCFALRATIGLQTLQPFAEQVREAVDKLLAIFCSDPLAEGLQSGADEVTPGGRKAFGSRGAQTEKSPFLPVNGIADGVGTPSVRQRERIAG